MSHEPAKQIVKREYTMVEKHIASLAREYDKHLRKFLAMGNLMYKFDKEVQEMKATYGHYPPVTKPWRAPYDLVELDEELEGVADGEVTLSITIPQGSTRRQAMERVYFFATVTNKEIMSGAVKKHYAAMEEKTTRKWFFEVCNSYESEIGLVHLKLDSPIPASYDSESLLKKIEEHYARIVMNIEDEKKQEAKAKEVQSEREKKKEQELLNSDPANLLDSLIQKRVADLVAGIPYHEYEGYDENDAENMDIDPSGNDASQTQKNDEVSVEKVCESIAKMVTANSRKSPGGGRGKGPGSSSSSGGKSGKSSNIQKGRGGAAGKGGVVSKEWLGWRRHIALQPWADHRAAQRRNEGGNGSGSTKGGNDWRMSTAAGPPGLPTPPRRKW